MPKRTDIKKILIIGSGPIVIGQACEFDYSGAQACKVLKQEGFQIVLVNSNPATIMTDPEMADRTYIEPLTLDFLKKIIEKEKPQALLPTLGGQTALNLSRDLAREGFLDKHNVELIGAKLHAIEKAEDRELFKKAMEKIGLEVPKSSVVKDKEKAKKVLEELGFPLVMRPSYTLGGMGGNIAYNQEEFEKYLEWGFFQSPVHEILLEESVQGWKEFELEVMRDNADNVIIVCSIENLDPMGVHTGDSITVAPIQTLTDKEYQVLREASKKIIREIGVDTGGSNIQFAVNPETGKMVVIEMNPRVSRSSALASKATGFPIAKIAAKLAVGYQLSEIANDITQKTPACFEPTLDYVVTKIPRFNFEKFPMTPRVLTTQMKSVGEVMAIGRTFKESLGKAIRSLEMGVHGFDNLKESRNFAHLSESEIKRELSTVTHKRLWIIAEAFRKGFATQTIHTLTKIDPWFLNHIKEMIELEGVIQCHSREGGNLDPHLLKKAKEWGFSDKWLSTLTTLSEIEIQLLREKENIEPVYKTIDTCAAEFESFTPYLYSTYDEEDESRISNKKKVVIIGSGPNRIGQGIEFDYCCVHAALSLKEEGFETIMINCNPETVSTDYDTSDKLYFEPLTFEDVLPILKKEKPEGVIVQLGGQTPLKLAYEIEKAGFKILGTSVKTIIASENREFFSKLINKLGLKQPPHALAHNEKEALLAAHKLGFPLVIRPSFVLGGRAMEIIYDNRNLEKYIKNAVQASEDEPLLIDRYIEDATEVDVDVLSDGKDVYVAGVLEHLEEAGVHSGDSTCSLPPFSLSPQTIEELKNQAQALALELNIIGLMNVQFALTKKDIFVLEVNPRASRTIPFIAKARKIPLVKIASKLMVGKKLSDVIPAHSAKHNSGDLKTKTFSVKRSVFPFIKYPHEDAVLGPEMKSTGEVMATEYTFPLALAKAAEAVNSPLPKKGNVFLSVKDSDKAKAFEIAAELQKCGFHIIATRGTAQFLKEKKMNHIESINKVLEGRPHVVDALKSGRIHLVINTTIGEQALRDSFDIRRTALEKQIPYFTTLSGGLGALHAIGAAQKEEFSIFCLQDLY
ncbi:MAG: carbamoyl-phosphate synthase large subunit [Deltaproteobacteria bacterium]|nr:carbamoyl-phosphate synthase large subunit [Deltaproteobacteria bacterium]